MTRQIVDPLSRVILAAIIMTVGCQVSGATIGAKSASLGDVESAIGSAHEGDTVIVPAGTASWTSTLVITKGITLKGATSIGGSISSPVVTDETIILDELPRRSPQNRPGRQKRSPGAQQHSAQGRRRFSGRWICARSGAHEYGSGWRGRSPHGSHACYYQCDAQAYPVLSFIGFYIQIWVGHNPC